MMNDTWNSIVIFAAGAAIGSFVTWRLIKAKYEAIAQEEIDSIKGKYSGREKSDELPRDFDEEAEESDDEVDVREYAAKLAESGYTNYSEIHEEKGVKEPMKNKPYVISPDEFGEMDGYKCISLSYWANGVLSYEKSGKLVEDVEDMIGVDNLTHFGDYEDDAVHVRNENTKCDYEILIDLRKYKDVVMKGRTSTNTED